MFENIGGKIKMVAAAICWIGIIVFVILGIKIMSAGDEAILPGFLILVLGSLFSWIGSFITYGFGQLVQNSDIISSRLMEIKGNTSSPKISSSGFTATNTESGTDSSLKWVCHSCGKMISTDICPFCGSQSQNESIDNRLRIDSNNPMSPVMFGACQSCGREGVLVIGLTVTDGVNTSIASLCEQCIDNLKNN